MTDTQFYVGPEGIKPMMDDVFYREADGWKVKSITLLTLDLAQGVVAVIFEKPDTSPLRGETIDSLTVAMASLTKDIDELAQRVDT